MMMVMMMIIMVVTSLSRSVTFVPYLRTLIGVLMMILAACDDDVDHDECEEKDFDGDDDDYNYGHCLLQIHHFCNLLVAAGESTCAHMSASLNKISRPKNVKI